MGCARAQLWQSREHGPIGTLKRTTLQEPCTSEPLRTVRAAVDAIPGHEQEHEPAGTRRKPKPCRNLTAQDAASGLKPWAPCAQYGDTVEVIQGMIESISLPEPAGNLKA